jgi:hypothetical protein
MTEPKAASRRWTSAEEKQLKELLDAGMTASEIAPRIKPHDPSHLRPIAADLYIATSQYLRLVRQPQRTDAPFQPILINL